MVYMATNPITLNLLHFVGCYCVTLRHMISIHRDAQHSLRLQIEFLCIFLTRVAL